MEVNKIYNEDCLETLKRMEDDSIDLIVTSPPYNKGYYAQKNARQSDVWSNLNGRKIAYDVFSDDMPPQEYEDWQKEIITQCVRVLKPSGSMFYNHKDIIYNGVIVPPKWVYDYNVREQIIWDRGSSPMIDPRYFMPVHEWIYWIVKNPKKTFFDKSKSAFKTNIWRMNPAKNPHPAPFPEILAGNCIAACSQEGGGNLRPVHGKRHDRIDGHEAKEKLYRQRNFANVCRYGRKANEKRSETTKFILI